MRNYMPNYAHAVGEAHFVHTNDNAHIVEPNNKYVCEKNIPAKPLVMTICPVHKCLDN